MATTFAVPDGRVAMAATTYTGTNATLAVSNAVNTVSFQPDLVWLKSRSIGASSHALYDTNRGARVMLQSNTTIADFTDSAGVGMTAFNANGFSLGTDTAASSCSVNGNGVTFIGWQWKAGGTAVSNTAGTITSSVSANTTAGFSVVTYTGTGANATVGHGLGVAPSMVIVKNRSSGVDGWPIYHVGLTSATFFIKLNSTDAQASAASIWNSTAPTLSVFSVGTSTGTNQSANTYVAYCWAPVAGYSAFGSYTGNGSADGPFIYTGFRPRWVMIKCSSAAGGWKIYNTSGLTYNTINTALEAQDAAAEVNSSSFNSDWLSNGFKLRTTYADFNTSGATYIYACFAENPLKFSNAR